MPRTIAFLTLLISLLFQSKEVTMLSGPVDTTASGIRTQTRLGVVVVRQISGSSPQLREKVGICSGMNQLTQVTADAVAELLKPIIR